MRLTLLSTALIVTFLSSCSAPPKNPFQPDRGRREGGNRRIVQLEVRCQECLISWRVGMDQGTASDRGTWSKRVIAHTDLGDTFASLSATPTETSGPVYWIRIRVDGKTVAEAGGGDDRGIPDQSGRRTLSVEAVIS